MQEHPETTEKTVPTSVRPASVPVAPVTPLWRDLLIPISIVVAGIFIGGGLFLSGGGNGSGTGSQMVAQETFQEKIYRLVDAAGVNKRDFDQCMQAGELRSRVQEDMANASATGGGGTPWSIVIGPTGKTYPINGALPAQAVEQIIELARQEGSLEGQDTLNTDAVNPVTDADHIKGSVNAPIKVVEYSDFDCPFCGRFHATMEQVTSRMDDVAWVYRQFPIEQLHPNAPTAALASECVAELEGDEAFWTFADGYFEI